jgi:hypothetical protein
MVVFQLQAGTRRTFPDDDGGGRHQNVREYKVIL